MAHYNRLCMIHFSCINEIWKLEFEVVKYRENENYIEDLVKKKKKSRKESTYRV